MERSDSRREALAKLIAEALGYKWDWLYANKSEWTADRHSRHDINTPMKPDFYAAADAVIEFEQSEQAGKKG